MTYVREQTSAELAAHMRSLQAMPGWFDPLADRLWQEVQQLQRDNAALMEDAAAQIEIAREAVERALRFEVVLERIAAIPNQLSGGDWDEIEYARRIACAALAQKEG